MKKDNNTEMTKEEFYEDVSNQLIALWTGNQKEINIDDAVILLEQSLTKTIIQASYNQRDYLYFEISKKQNSTS